MSKYNFELDMASNNPNSVILKSITPNSKVLELGCAHGRMTRYMKETLNCSVDTVELDEEAGKMAATWANKSFAGNLEDHDLWDELDSLGCNNYDFIIFADVLEHLHDPARVLASSKKLLSPKGSIWISIPNIAHNAIIIELLNDSFPYRDTGLLDSTHVKFFTLSSLIQMVNTCGLEVISMLEFVTPLKYTEFNNSYSDVPKEIANYLQKRDRGEVYQFVLELIPIE